MSQTRTEHTNEEDELISNYQRVMEEIGRLPTQSELSTIGNIPVVKYTEEYGRWPKPAREICDVLGVSYYSSETVSRAEEMADEVGENLPISDEILQQANDILIERLKEGPIYGCVLENIVGATILIACYQNDLGVPTGAIESVIGSENISRPYRRLSQTLGLQVLPPDTSTYVNYIGEALGLDDDIVERANELIDNAPQSTLNKSNNGLAAAAIYVASNEAGNSLTQEEVADVAHTSCVTIRKTQKELN